MILDAIKAMDDAKEAMSDGAFQQAGTALSDAKNIVREEAQKRTSDDIRKIIKKLRSDERLSSEEITLIKAWITGDATGYTKMENNFQDWLSEYERLRRSLSDYEKKACSPEDLLMLHGILEDAIRITYDIAIFLEKKDRIKKFESVVADGLDQDERQMLVKVLTRKLDSTNY